MPSPAKSAVSLGGRLRAGRRGLCWVLALGTVCGVLVPGARALDFTLQSKTLREDNLSHVQLYFQYDPANLVYIQAPTGWQLQGNPASLEATLPACPECGVRLQKSGLTPALPFAGDGLESYRRAAIQQAPPGATKVQIAIEKPDPLPVFGWKDYEFTLTYELFGQLCAKAVIFINLDARQQLLATCTAPKDKFENLRTGCDELLRSWQLMPGK